MHEVKDICALCSLVWDICLLLTMMCMFGRESAKDAQERLVREIKESRKREKLEKHQQASMVEAQKEKSDPIKDMADEFLQVCSCWQSV